ncbi:MAG TPA: hypothetical protein EYN91_20225 [Candidatus Melainabacteria bacterium]|nr:hypothetical protein [Candidatus Melainabacteria bacterium]HIN63452.1 hypothetical protein [Candidatus Obscuribacterales bacterium]
MPETKDDRWFSKLAAAAKDLIPSPIPSDKKVENALEKLKESREKALNHITQSIASEKVAMMKIADHMESAKRWEVRAQMATEQGNQTLAEEALKRKAQCVESVREWHRHVPSTRQQNIELTAKLQGFNVIVHRIIVLRDLLRSIKSKTELSESLSSTIKSLVAEFPDFSKDNERLMQEFNLLLEVADQRLCKLEQQVSHRVQSVINAGEKGSYIVELATQSCQASTSHTLKKLEEDLIKWRAEEARTDPQEDEDAYWRARQFYWATEKSVEYMKRSLEAINQIKLKSIGVDDIDSDGSS